ncbi:MAG: hypothetical protein GY719_29070 [bacterium]|nr:hypothetical protein [bacterium]
MGVEINLLHGLGRGRAWVEITLDLDPEDFEPEHVRRLTRVAAEYSGVEATEVRVRGVARWRPIVALELPAEAGARIVRGFEASDPRLTRALGSLVAESIRLDSETGSKTRELPYQLAVIWLLIRPFGGLIRFLLMLAAAIVVVYLGALLWVTIEKIFGG